MSFVEILKVIVPGIVEGFTEWLHQQYRAYDSGG